ncbi:hypothetical protein [Mameliella sediminis]|uniref:hypothetical protein n=1 Tax=Mameliella sediminis TaxID=2836866 RepID=UPI001C453BB7|nr:hypothetical protein [Mameliella sediminis]MBY6113922.1 hypothetical protein [Antarctobacter heliothermus]MBY6142730.1 hypothetical protein [Mameliella alba]MBV7395219.1 hypothetical protein [Mameliella sediminis]MBY6159585.1 hypothetical protein [Mameliella alba]MBY6168056.1 hypothetical protein [Mameliella alba]
MSFQNQVTGLLFGAIAGLIGGYLGYQVVDGPFLGATGSDATTRTPVSPLHVLAVSAPFVVVMIVLGITRLGYDLIWALAVTLLTPVIYFGAIHLAVEIYEVTSKIQESDGNNGLIFSMSVTGAVAAGLLALLSNLVAARFDDLLPGIVFPALLCGAFSGLGMLGNTVPVLSAMIPDFNLMTVGWQACFVWMLAAHGPDRRRVTAKSLRP